MTPRRVTFALLAFLTLLACGPALGDWVQTTLNPWVVIGGGLAVLVALGLLVTAPAPRRGL